MITPRTGALSPANSAFNSDQPMNDNNKNNKPKKKLPLNSLPPNQTSKLQLSWDPEKHDHQIQSRLSEESKSKARSLISRAYSEWKRRLQRRIKKGEIKTRQELIQEVYALHEIVAREASAPEMFEYRSFTLDLVEDKIGELVLTNGWAKNLFTEFVPEQASSHTFTVPQRHTFETLEDFEAIPWIKSFRDKVGFVGFVRDLRQIWALFKDGEITQVGVVAGIKGLERLPTRQELQKELLKEKAP